MSQRVDYNSPLKRTKWLLSKLKESAHKSFWNPYIGTSYNAIIYRVNDISCASGQNVIFDMSGKLTGSGVKGDGEACEVGEGKRKFSSALTVEMYSLYVNNGTKFSACDIGDLRIAEHSHSVGLLRDLYGRHKDQFIFDVFQSASKATCNPTHIYNLGCSFEWNDILYLRLAATTGKNLVKSNDNGTPSEIDAPLRAPLEGFRTANGEPVFLCVIDTYMATALKSNPKYQTIKLQGDVRGEKNAVMSGVIGKDHNIVFVEASNFYGVTKGKGKFEPIVDVEPQFAGLRLYGVGEDGIQVWQGQPAFDKVQRAHDEEVAVRDLARADLPAKEAAVDVAQKEWENAQPADKPAALDALNDAKAELLATREAAEAEIKNRVWSRGLLLGAGAGQLAYGKTPRYAVEFTAFKKSSRSMLEFVTNFQKTKLSLEMGTEYAAKINDIDYAVIAVDFEH